VTPLLLQGTLLKLLFGIAGLSCFSFNALDFKWPNFAGSEICENAIDDDGDGLIDLNDPDCDCEIIAPVSLIPNPSFEDMDCCPSAPSQLQCAAVWIQASEPTTDFIHMCDFMGWPDFPPPLPFPDGEGCMGFRDGRVRGDILTAEYNWKEYAGACLLGPLIADTPYLFEFYVGFVDRFKSPPINISFFGTTDCANLPFGVGDEDLGCPTNGPGWVRLGSTLVNGGTGNKWIKTSIEVIPQENITAIAIGPDCPIVPSPISIYYFFDNLTLADLRSFQFKITEQSHPCADDFALQVPEVNEFSYQWYKNGIALPGETFPHLMSMYGEGNYQVRIMDGSSCLLSGIYTYTLPLLTNSVQTIICDGEMYSFGDLELNASGHYVDTFKTIFNCDSIVYLDLQVLGIEADSAQAKIFEGEVYEIGSEHYTEEGNYLVHLLSSKNCDSLVFLELTYYHIFIPNIFSPNGDGINDQFIITSKDDLIEKINIHIFDRWGNQLFSGAKWDGTSHDADVGTGAYVYVAELIMDDGIERQFSGSVTLIR
jgi:gliding motility-associated-like protein